jgi:hypothetical protein
MAPANTPWWSNLVAVLLTAIVSVVGTLYAMRPRAPGEPVVSTMGSLFKDTISYIPHILLLFGILADMFTYEGVYSIPSLIGLLSIPLNWVMKYFWAGIEEVIGKALEVIRWRAETPPNPRAAVPGRNIVSGGAIGDFFKDYDGCTVQGFSWAASKYAPQTLVVTATVFSYYMFDLIVNRGWLNATATIVVFAVLYGAQVMVIGNCSKDPLNEPGRAAKAIAALAEGLLFGGSSYAIVQAYAPTRLPSSAVSPFPAKSANDLKPGPDGTMVDEQGRRYVCMPNGLCYPDLSDPSSKMGFASDLANSLGTGMPAVGANCPAAPTGPPAAPSATSPSPVPPAAAPAPTTANV